MLSYEARHHGPWVPSLTSSLSPSNKEHNVIVCGRYSRWQALTKAKALSTFSRGFLFTSGSQCAYWHSEEGQPHPV
jgi:hypothetical protein